MASFQEYRRRGLLPVAGVILAAYYFLVFVPLAHRAESLDEPLQKSWGKLTDSLGRTNALTIDFRHITNQLSETRVALAQIEATKKQAAVRLEVAPALRAKLDAPFQLVEFEYDRSKKSDDLARQAAEQKVTLDPAVLAGLPEHTTDVKEPALLWAALDLANDLVGTALRCKVSAVHSLEAPLTLTNAPIAEGSTRWAQVPLQIEFTASGDSATKFLESLPLRADEIRAAGLPEAPPAKAPLSIERLILKKQSPEKLDEVRVWVRAVGFVLRE